MNYFVQGLQGRPGLIVAIVILLTYKLQPLDRTVFGPLKKALNIACDSWMVNNPEKSMTIYNVPDIICTALPQAVTYQNIRSAFRVSGIYPFNRNILGDIDFASSTVTDLPCPESNNVKLGTNNDGHGQAYQ